MAMVTCPVCGRVVVTAAPLEALPPEERRCPRCGFVLGSERRTVERRQNRPRRDDGPTSHSS